MLKPIDEQLHEAVKKGQKKIVKKLLKEGADVNAKDNNGDTPLHVAVKMNQMSIVKRISIIKILLNKKATIEAKNNEGNTPLHLAVKNSSMLTVRLLLEKKANIEAKNNEGNTPFHLAVVIIDGGEIATLLLNKKANIEAKNNEGNTPLHLVASLAERGNTLKFLLGKGANIEATNNEGKTALDLSINKYHCSNALMLVNEGAKNLEPQTLDTYLNQDHPMHHRTHYTIHDDIMLLLVLQCVNFKDNTEALKDFFSTIPKENTFSIVEKAVKISMEKSWYKSAEYSISIIDKDAIEAQKKSMSFWKRILILCLNIIYIYPFREEIINSCMKGLKEKQEKKQKEENIQITPDTEDIQPQSQKLPEVDKSPDSQCNFLKNTSNTMTTSACVPKHGISFSQ